MIKPKIKDIKKYLKKIVWSVGKHSFIAFLLLFLLALILGGFVFYQYSFLAEKSEPQTAIQPLEFKESLYQEILEEWNERQDNFGGAEGKEYPDLFRSLPAKEESPPEEL
jgi:hypothetical protein